MTLFILVKLYITADLRTNPTCLNLWFMCVTVFGFYWYLQMLQKVNKHMSIYENCLCSFSYAHTCSAVLWLRLIINPETSEDFKRKCLLFKHISPSVVLFLHKIGLARLLSWGCSSSKDTSLEKPSCFLSTFTTLCFVSRQWGSSWHCKQPWARTEQVYNCVDSQFRWWKFRS